MSRASTYLKITSVFIGGILLGSVGVNFFRHGDRGCYRSGPPQEMRQHFMEKMSDKLDLSDEQKVQLEPVIKDMQSQFTDIRLTKQDAIRGIVEDAITKAKPVLDSDQQKKLDALYQTLQDRWKEENQKE